MSSNDILLSSQGKSTKRLTYALWRSICKMGWGWMIPHKWRSTLVYVCVVTTGVKHRLSLSLSLTEDGGRRRMVFELCRRRQCCWTMIRSAGGCFRLYTSGGTWTLKHNEFAKIGKKVMIKNRKVGDKTKQQQRSNVKPPRKCCSQVNNIECFTYIHTYILT